MFRQLGCPKPSALFKTCVKDWFLAKHVDYVIILSHPCHRWLGGHCESLSHGWSWKVKLVHNWWSRWCLRRTCWRWGSRRGRWRSWRGRWRRSKHFHAAQTLQSAENQYENKHSHKNQGMWQAAPHSPNLFLISYTFSWTHFCIHIEGVGLRSFKVKP